MIKWYTCNTARYKKDKDLGKAFLKKNKIVYFTLSQKLQQNYIRVTKKREEEMVISRCNADLNKEKKIDIGNLVNTAINKDRSVPSGIQKIIVGDKA